MSFSAILLAIAAATTLPVRPNDGSPHGHHHTAYRAFTGCHRVNCMDDPAAWRALLGDRHDDRAAQALAKQATLAWAQQQQQQQQQQAASRTAKWQAAMQQEKLVQILEGRLSQLTLSKVTITAARLKSHGDGYVVCGSALHGYAGAGDMFVINSNPGGIVSAHATREDYLAGGCDSPGTGLALR